MSHLPCSPLVYLLFQKFKSLFQVRKYTGNVSRGSTRPQMQSHPSQWTRHADPPFCKCAKFKTEKSRSLLAFSYRGLDKIHSEILHLVMVVGEIEGSYSIRIEVVVNWHCHGFVVDFCGMSQARTANQTQSLWYSTVQCCQMCLLSRKTPEVKHHIGLIDH
jgi:hypothetical protein